MYEPLSKLYYKSPHKYEPEYEKRFNSYSAIKLPFQIKPHKSNAQFSCFYVNHAELDLLHDQILKQSRMIESMSRQLPMIAITQYMHAKMIEELLSTNEIEGVRSTRRELQDAIEMIIRPDAVKKQKVRHLDLMRTYISLLSETKEDIQTLEEIRDIYDRLVKEEMAESNLPDGRLFRKDLVDVKTATEKIVHKGVYPEQAIEAHLTSLIHYLNEHPSPMLYKIAIAHYYFGYIHPFYDGNGRTSRYISSMYLKHDLEPLTAFTLSYATNQVKRMYYDAFDLCNNPLNKGELTSFCEAFFHILNHAQNDILADLSEKQHNLKKLSHLIEQCKASEEAKNILYILGQSYIFGMEGRGMTRSELIAVTEKTAYVMSKLLDELKELELIEVLRKKPLEVRISERLRGQLDG